MSKIIIGCDPDSNKSGFAFVVNGEFLRIECLSLISFYIELDSLCDQIGADHIELHIENVKGKKAVWHNRKGSQAAYGMTCQRVGQCKQVQAEIERIADYLNVKTVLHAASSNWKDAAGKEQFEKVTGWIVRSNEDGRSAAYFAYLGLTRSKR